MSERRIFIVADDLTGACDSAVAFLASGRRASVVLEDGCEDCGDDVLAYTTDSRNSSVEEAWRRVTEKVCALRAGEGEALVLKKVDSAARGQFAAEIEAAFSASGADIALLAPGFPEAGRTVRHGVLRVQDFAGHDASVDLQTLFTGGTANLCASGSAAQTKMAIEHAYRAGVHILIRDSETQAELEELVEAALLTGLNVLWCGSAGLAHALSGGLPGGRGAATPRLPHREGRAVLFAGSPHPVTAHQISRIGSDHGATHLIDPGRTTEEEVRALFGAGPVGAVILTGGDTAAFVLRTLGAERIQLMGEVAHGTPWGVVGGGLAHGCAVITKSGGFGHQDALVDALRFCERRVCEPA